MAYPHAYAPDLADFIELRIGIGLREGKALSLRWADVRLDRNFPSVRWTLSALDKHPVRHNRAEIL
ncbi:hypothetical protein ACFC4G_32730 [Streptomyces sp. NPDC056002]|uniref:hypothetical protein n=1 Tax=unclassified Streptomyces TaxID=2593676 RepID=UPI0030C9FBB0